MFGDWSLCSDWTYDSHTSASFVRDMHYYSTPISCQHLNLLESSLRVATLTKPPITLVKSETTADLEERANEDDSLGGQEQQPNEEARFNEQLT